MKSGVYFAATWFFPIKGQFWTDQNHEQKSTINQQSAMEKYLDNLETPRHQQQETFHGEKKYQFGTIMESQWTPIFLMAARRRPKCLKKTIKIFIKSIMETVR